MGKLRICPINQSLMALKIRCSCRRQFIHDFEAQMSLHGAEVTIVVQERVPVGDAESADDEIDGSSLGASLQN
jgi:hypothetical protein